METIKNYLENMFSHLPNTPEVQKAKYELYQMMEDKYNELISEGKSDNEAIGIVISEFGNLDELADSLGIKSFVNPSQAMPAAKTLSRETAAAFLRDSAKQAYLTAFGVLLCIIASLGRYSANAFRVHSLHRTHLMQSALPSCSCVSQWQSASSFFQALSHPSGAT